ncbi:MAG TPA: hypothetical protein VMW35_08235 [Myxococcota bacterium]|nr:hypothetical protein [Myxococcota bacterium]
MLLGGPLFLELGASCAAPGPVWYVDATTGNDSNDGLSPGSAFRTIATAVRKLKAGDTVRIVGGSVPYDEALNVTTSGTTDEPIVIEGFGATPPVLITNNLGNPPIPRVCIRIAYASHVIVRNLVCDGRGGPGYDYRSTGFSSFVEIQGADHSSIEGCTFRGAVPGRPQNNAYGYGMGINIVSALSDAKSLRFASYNRIAGNQLLPNVLPLPVELVHVEPFSQHNLIEDNRIVPGVTGYMHNAVQLLSSYNVVRNNEISSPGGQHMIEILRNDVPGGPGLPQIDPAVRNVVEGNRMHHAGKPSKGVESFAFQLWGPQNVVRRNVFDSNPSGVLLIGRGTNPEHGRYLKLNHFYHNVVYGNGNLLPIGGIPLTIAINCDAVLYGNTQGNAFVNNVLYRNNVNTGRQISVDMGLASGPICSGPGVPHGPDVFGPNLTVIAGNSIRIDSNVAPGMRTVHIKRAAPAPSDLSVDETEAAYPTYARANLEDEPGFVDPTAATPDFHLQTGSPMIDRGQFLTTVVATSSTDPTVVRVADPGFFSDGNGIVPGDQVQLQGSTSWAGVLRVDDATGDLHLDRGLPGATAGRGIALRYNGVAPDIGAYER